MANEFKIKNGLIVSGDVNIAGNVFATGGTAATQSWVNEQGYLNTVPTLDQVTTAGNTTTNNLTIGNLTINTTGLTDIRSSSTFRFVLSNSNNLAPTFGPDGLGISGGNYGSLIYATKGLSFATIPDSSLYTGASASVFLSNGSYASAVAPNGLGVGATIPFGTRFYVQTNTNVVGGSSFWVAQLYSASNTKRFGIRNDGYVDINTDALVAHPTKNITIGTTTDSGYKLEVVGNQRVTNSIVVENSNWFGTSIHSNQFQTYLTFTGGSFTFKHTDSVGQYTERNYLTVRNNGRVAINSQVADTTLHVHGDAKVNTSTYLAIDSGNVGVGTTSPAAKLDVLVSGTNITTLLGRGSDANFRLVTRQNHDANGNEVIIGEIGLAYIGGINSSVRFHRGSSASGGFVSFSTNNNNERVRISTNGNVLIGTTTDAGYKLEVNGTARLSGNTSIGGNLAIGLTGTSYGLEVTTTSNLSRVLVGGVGPFVDELETRIFRSHMMGSYPFDSEAHLILQPTTASFPEGDIVLMTRQDAANTVPRLVVKASGKVGIGTPTPSSELEIQGFVNATGYLAQGATGYTGLLQIPGNPPGSQNIFISGGIITNIA